MRPQFFINSEFGMRNSELRQSLDIRASFSTLRKGRSKNFPDAETTDAGGLSFLKNTRAGKSAYRIKTADLDASWRTKAVLKKQNYRQQKRAFCFLCRSGQRKRHSGISAERLTFIAELYIRK